jgi:KDO2-lipid IV(A) lauroyltransferase
MTRLALLRLKRQLVRYGDRILGRVVKYLIRMLRRTDPERAADLCAAVARRLGPLLPAHRIGQENLRAAFPEKDAAWIEATLREAWDNLGRVAGEYVHMAQIWDFDPAHPNNGRILTDAADMFETLRNDGKPALCFAAHLGNWELPAVVAAAQGLPSAVVYRMPNNKAVAKEITRIRAPLMGQLIRTRAQAALEMAAALERGKHLGMVVDQHFSRGIDVTFFGRRCKANPTIARLARRFDCPVVGARVIRLPDRRFMIAAEGPFDLPRDAEGLVDVAATTQMITDVIERWVRENPGQYLWFHRRWR